ncbi:hypothetical protein HIM_02729 [Hirsutella minnesotensis 3608]|nr:hypothetical protein HIM_02729 [Hirsutella minnesotensis 3608]
MDLDSDSETRPDGRGRLDTRDAGLTYPPDDIEPPWLDQKRKDIVDACKWRDVSTLRSLAESKQGLLDDNLRRAAWPILLGVQSSKAAPDDPDTCSQGDDAAFAADWNGLPPHRDEGQVQLDVNRSFIYYPNDQSDKELERCKTELSSLIVEVLRRFPYLCYFQGYHDICQVFMLVLSPACRARAVARLSVLRIRDFMLPSLAPTTAQLRLLPDLLAKADPKLRRHIASIEPFYALAGTLTMYAHNIENYRDIVRLFDLFLTREPVFSIYIFAQIVVDRREEILDIDEPDMLQVILAKVPARMDLDALIAKSINLFQRHPPETLKSWRYISSASVLKTARAMYDCSRQTMDQGQSYFQRQLKDIWWDDVRDKAYAMLWRYRRPARIVGMAFLVALAGIYLRRNPVAVHYILSTFQR